MRKDSPIELYRCLLMYGVVILHVIGFYDRQYHWLSSCFLWCVPGFVFITGYFGAKFSWRKLLKLYGVALWCYFSTFLFCMIFVDGDFGLQRYFSLTWKWFVDSWFVHGYVVMLMVAPIIDSAITAIGENLKKALLIFGPFLIYIYGWSFVTSYSTAKGIVPISQSSKVLVLLGMYTSARLYKVYNLERFLTPVRAWALLLCCLGLASLKIGNYYSPLVVLMAGTFFYLCRQVRCSGTIGKCLSFIGAGTFSIFLIHTNPWTLGWLRRMVDCVCAVGCPIYLSFIIVATAVYALAFIADFPRRIVVWLCSSYVFGKKETKTS